MLNKIKAWLYSRRLIREDDFRMITPAVQAETSFVDTRDQDTKKRVAAAFEAQSKQMHIRAMKSHGCKDPLTCKKYSCFKPVPDKIVAETILTKVEVDKELGR